MLLDALGCAGSARYVALWRGGGTGGEVLWTDGSASGVAAPHAWAVLTRRTVLCRVIFGTYELEDEPAAPTWEPAHRLVADRRHATLDVALADDVPMLLAAEPASRVATAPAPPARSRRDELVAALCAWLDATLEWVDTGAGTLAGAPAGDAPAPAA